MSDQAESTTGRAEESAAASEDASDLDDRYRRVVRKARYRRLVPSLCVAAAIYLPAAKGELRFLGLDHLSWGDAVDKTVIWLVGMGVLWVLPFEWTPSPSGYGSLGPAERVAVDEAIDTARPPTDPLLRRVADEFAKRAMRFGEPTRGYVIGLVVVAIVACILAAQWWVLVLWLGVIAYAAFGLWRRRGLATKAERYLTAPR